MNNNSFKITDIKLHNFRNYTNCHISSEEKSVLLAGHNGAGKTSVLEAISYFTPGRGIRNASPDELKHHFSDNWAINIGLSNGFETINMSTGLVETKSGSKRLYKIDGENVKSSQAFLNKIKMLWLTPQIDSVFLSSSQNRRKFLDRIVYNFDETHAEKITEYEKKIRERSIILKMHILDEKWLDILESDIAKLNLEITHKRLKVIEIINNIIFSYEGLFPRTKIGLKCEVAKLIRHDVSTEEIQQKYKDKRQVDKLSGRTNFGCHRSDLDLIHEESGRSFHICSTGEQKSMIIGTIIFQAMALRDQKLPLPILLLDEIMAHLDDDKRQGLIDTIRQMNIQSFITSTHTEFWSEINFPAKFYEVKNAGISEINRVE
ncbi:MAG: DNA replication/repair protein RecF [Alphaproteobacteria bacterium]|nr:DNA replication/repair protein RecF [Alphaproteobacteria bacterium]OJV15778.1 MAG: hypothetical protein BGO27_07675 [Alphaproteobacteria bacterium 33-17]